MSLFTTTRRSAGVLRCDPGLLYDILTDYDNYVEWFPRVAQSKALAREGDLALAEFGLAPPQRGKFVIECIHTRNKMVLWRTIEGRIPVSQVEWTIEPAGEGQSQVRLSVTSRRDWNPFASGYGKFLKPAACLKALEAQVSTFMPEIALIDVEGEKILDLVETEEGVICWIRGKKYVLKRDSEENHD